MIRAIAILQKEHQSMRALFRHMESLLHELIDGQPADFRLLHEIGEYLSGYPDQCHHPKEDLIYRKMIRRNPTLLDPDRDLLGDHERLSGMIDRYVSRLAQMRNDPKASNEKFMSAMTELVDFYKRHIEMEETLFFPQAIDVLNKDDWEEVNFAVSEQDDPLFDEASSKYIKLRDEIYRLAEKHNLPAGFQAPRPLSALAALNTADQFNAMMTSRGLPVKLRKNEQGSYELVDSQHTLLEIPQCSEKCAIWCAYGFVKGKFS
jgi:hemerythrin-like domain-containing protein